MEPGQLSEYFAFYGSLRRGMVNFPAFAAGLDYRFSAWLPGYKMYALEDYPCVVKAGPESKILVEIMQAKDSAWGVRIHQFELDAGYRYETIFFNGYILGLYYFTHPPNDRVVSSGDWVTFFRQSGRA